MNERDLLMIPGPTNVDPIVLRSMARPTVHTWIPRGESRASIMKEQKYRSKTTTSFLSNVSSRPRSNAVSPVSLPS